MLPDENPKKQDIAQKVVQSWTSNSLASGREIMYNFGQYNFSKMYNSSSIINLYSADVLLGALSSCPDLTSLFPPLCGRLLAARDFRLRQGPLENLYRLVVGGLESVAANWKAYRNRATVIEILQCIEGLVVLKDSFISSLVLGNLGYVIKY